MIYLTPQQDSDLRTQVKWLWGNTTLTDDEWNALDRSDVLELQLGLMPADAFVKVTPEVVRFELNP